MEYAIMEKLTETRERSRLCRLSKLLTQDLREVEGIKYIRVSVFHKYLNRNICGQPKAIYP